MAAYSCQVRVMLSPEESREADSTQLVPGDVIEVP